MSSLSNTAKNIERVNRLNDSFKAIENAPPLLIGIVPLMFMHSLPSPVSACIAGAAYKYHLNVAKEENSLYNKMGNCLGNFVKKYIVGENNARALVRAGENIRLSVQGPEEQSAHLDKKLKNFGNFLAKKLYPYILAGAALKVLSNLNIKTSALAFICGMGAMKALEQRTETALKQRTD